MGPPRILLVEPQFVLRRTLVAVGRDLGVVEFHEAASLERARMLLDVEAFHGLVLDFQDSDRALILLDELRKGGFASAPDAHVVVLAAALRPDEERRLQGVGVSMVLQRPFKIGQLLECLASGCAVPKALV